MADIRVQFCGELKIRGEAEMDWLSNAMNQIYYFAAEKKEAGTLLPKPKLFNLGPFADYILQEETIGFRCTFMQNSVIFTDEVGQGEIDLVAELVSQFMSVFRPEDTWFMEWAETCTLTRPNEFGGGILLVNARTFQSISTSMLQKLTVGELRQMINRYKL